MGERCGEWNAHASPQPRATVGILDVHRALRRLVDAQGESEGSRQAQRDTRTRATSLGLMRLAEFPSLSILLRPVRREGRGSKKPTPILTFSPPTPMRFL